MPRVVMAALLGCALAACHGSTAGPAERASWSATAGMVVDAWRRGAVPRRYAADTLRVAADRLRDPALARTADRIARGDRAVAAGGP